MSVKPFEAIRFYQAVQKGVRSAAGRALTPALKRWRNTRSGDSADPKLRAPATRFLVRYGLLDGGWPKEAQEQAYAEILRRVARASGDAAGVIASWLDAFSSGEYGLIEEGTCDEQAHCDRCPLCEGCQFLSAGARVIQVSGEALAQTLAETPEQRHVRPRATDLLAFLISDGRGGAAAMARAEALLKTHGGLRGVLAAQPEDLRKAGLDAHAAALVRAVAELFQLWTEEEDRRGKTFACGRDFFEHYRLRMRNLKKERFFVACLDQKNRMLGEELVSEGTLTQTLVHPREVFNPAIRMQAAAVAVVHNHPSGDPAPSREDKQLTKRLGEVAELVGIRLLDHVIVGDGTYTSFVERGLL
ncbi:MAG: DNA repair protein RadC [Planctomycetes bacterium]|nr:DNA repair protein RadC [Planctomycetota bacterium]